MFITALIIISLFQADGAADEAKLVEAIRQYHERLEQAIAREMAAAKKSRDGRQVKALSAALKQLQKTPLSVPKLSPTKLSVGSIGQLIGGHTGEHDRHPNRFKVYHVVDSSNMIVSKEAGNYVDDRTEIVYHSDFYLWISDVSTTNVIDEQFVQLPQIFIVDSTDKFGSMTMFKLKPFPIQNADIALRKAKASKK